MLLESVTIGTLYMQKLLYSLFLRPRYISQDIIIRIQSCDEMWPRSYTIVPTLDGLWLQAKLNTIIETSISYDQEKSMYLRLV